jgi:branched-chain amino acid aminotransferase
LSPRIKCGANYINSRVGQREALRNGYDTCIFLNEVGKVAEGPGSCFFMIRGNQLITPRLTDSVLESITRDTVIKLAVEELGMEFVERTIDRTEVYMADEAFLCGSAMEVTPIYTVDRYAIGTGEQGPKTKAIHLKYLEAAQGKLENRKDWLTPIYEK